MRNSANIVEIFSSVQGEGPYIGYRQIFVRFALCNLNCKYCDTDFKPQEYCKIETKPGSGIFDKVKNPITTEHLIQIINEFNFFHHHSLSLTGGEPLMSNDFLIDFLKQFKKTSPLKIYLETNGTLPEELEKVVSLTDIVAMDFKLESSYGKPAPWEKHKQFIQVAQENFKEVFAKIIITKDITDNEIENIIDLVTSLSKKIPIILQPVTGNNLAPASIQLLNIQETLLKKISDVRIIPQTHKMLNLL